MPILCRLIRKECEWKEESLAVRVDRRVPVSETKASEAKEGALKSTPVTLSTNGELDTRVQKAFKEMKGLRVHCLAASGHESIILITPESKKDDMVKNDNKNTRDAMHALTLSNILSDSDQEKLRIRINKQQGIAGVTPSGSVATWFWSDTEDDDLIEPKSPRPKTP